MELFTNKNERILIDDEDYPFLSKFTWRLMRGYVCRTKNYRENKVKTTKAIMLHREIMNAPKGMTVDHINGDKLDNRKCNLRICTQADNSKNRRISSNNTSGFKGVSWISSRNRYVAQIRINKKGITLGYFKCKIEAAKAYNAAALKYHGKFASLNLIQ